MWGSMWEGAEWKGVVKCGGVEESGGRKEGRTEKK